MSSDSFESQESSRRPSVSSSTSAGKFMWLDEAESVGSGPHYYIDVNVLSSLAADSHTAWSMLAGTHASGNLNYVGTPVYLQASHSLIRNYLTRDVENFDNAEWSKTVRLLKLALRAPSATSSQVVELNHARPETILDSLGLSERTPLAVRDGLMAKIRKSTLVTRLGALVWVLALALLSLVASLIALIVLLGDTFGYSFFTSAAFAGIGAAAGSAVASIVTAVGAYSDRARTGSVLIGERRYRDPVLQRIFLGEAAESRDQLDVAGSNLGAA